MVPVLIYTETEAEDVNAEVFEPGSEIESSIDRRDNDSSETSSGDSMQLDNIYSDADLTDIARAGTELTPPCNHRGTCDKSLICQCCNKAYCIYQSEYFTRHWKKCKSITDESDHEPGKYNNYKIVNNNITFRDRL